MIYFTSDLHFYHDNIIHHCQRPFWSSDEMNDVITLEEMIAAGKVLERMIDYKDCPKCR